MAAPTRNICGCCSNKLVMAVNKTRHCLPCSRNVKIVLNFRTRWNCHKANVMLPENKTLMSRPLRFYADKRLSLTATRTPETTHIAFSTFNFTVDRFLFLRVHKTYSCCTLLKRPSMRLQKTLTSDELTMPDRYFCQLNRVNATKSNAQRKINYEGLKTSSGKTEKKENIKTIPNLLTTMRMTSAPLIGYLVVCGSFGWALSLFAAAGITDMLDGYIARSFPNQTSALGTALDPLADKLLVTILTISLTAVDLIPLPLTSLIVFRDCFLIAGGFYIRYRSLPPPITLSRYFDISHATVSLLPTFISKLNTGLQLSLVACSLAAPVFGFVDHICLQALWFVTGTTTFLSGVDYMCSWKKYVKLLEKDQKEL